MASCTLEITLDVPSDPDRFMPVLGPFTPVTGHVDVAVDEQVRCDGLDVEVRLLRHDHHGEGGSTDGRKELHAVMAKQRLFAGDWQPGMHRYPFSLPPPERPSYAGQRASWEWVARVTADIPWAADPSDQAPFRVETAVDDHDGILYEPRTVETSGGASIAETLKKYAIGFFVMPAFGLVAAALIHAALGLEGNALLFAGCALAGELWLVHLVMRALRRQRDRLGPTVEIAVDRPQASYRVGGEPGSADLRLRGVADRRAAGGLVEHVWVDLRVVEETARVTSSSEGGSQYRPLRTTLWHQDQRVEADPDDRFRFDLPLPAAGTMPFSTTRDERGRGVYWQLEVRVVREDRPDEERAACEIDVRPAAILGQPAAGR